MLAACVIATGCSDSGGERDGETTSLPADLCPAVSAAAPVDWEASVDREAEDGTECTIAAGSGEPTVLTVSWTDSGENAEDALAEGCDFLFQAEPDGDQCVAEQPDRGGGAPTGRAGRAFLAGESQGVVALSAYTEDPDRADDLEGVLDGIEDELVG